MKRSRIAAVVFLLTARDAVDSALRALGYEPPVETEGYRVPAISCGTWPDTYGSVENMSVNATSVQMWAKWTGAAR